VYTVRRLFALALVTACGCATREPPPKPEDPLLVAMASEFPRDANVYQLVSIDEVAPGKKLARFERPAPQASSTGLARIWVAFCASGETRWRCAGPIEGAQVPYEGTSYSVLAPFALEDAALVSILGYVGSSCFAADAEKLGISWERSRTRSVDREGKDYIVQLAGTDGFYRLRIEPTARAESSAECAYEVRDVSTLTQLAP